MPYRMTPSVRHRAIEVHYYYYYYYYYIIIIIIIMSYLLSFVAKKSIDLAFTNSGGRHYI